MHLLIDFTDVLVVISLLGSALLMSIRNEGTVTPSQLPRESVVVQRWAWFEEGAGAPSRASSSTLKVRATRYKGRPFTCS